jgi:uncharacterized hydrophobic protein (TIGR00271 family)
VTPRSIAHRVQDHLLAVLGRSPADRATVVGGMVAAKRGELAGYWLQLVIATTLATLGLALSSTAVVIGAMLIAPLMRPLVELAMGLATGSAALTLRAAYRTLASVAVVVLVATALTWLLPFHEITAELEARTVPSLLDLAVAAACALAAAYATLRADADIATTAAGTSIGISLVPPLCAAGYGLAIGDPAVSRSAALLFTANLSGILVVASLVFVLVGFAQVDIRHEEEAFDAVASRRTVVRVGRAWSRLAAKRLGPFARVVPPLLLLGLVFVPLQRAVGEIQHRGKIRQTVAQLLDGDKRRVVQYTLEHTASAVVLRAVVVGDARTASELEKELRRRLAVLAVESPRIAVWAVPDAAAVSALSHRVDELPPPTVAEPAPKVARRYSSEVAATLRSAWPESGTGALLGLQLDLDRPEHIRVVHLGVPLGAAGVQLLARAVEPTTGPLQIDEDVLSPIEAPPGDGAPWLARAADLVARARLVPGLHLCVSLVPAPAGAGRTAPIASSVVAIRGAAEQLLSGIADITEGERWRIAPSLDGCAPAAPKAPTPP